MTPRIRCIALLVASLFVAAAAPSSIADNTDVFIKYKHERVTNGRLDLEWHNGFNISNNMQPLTLPPEHPAYANPSGDHTVANATNSMPDSGGVILTVIDPEAVKDYRWEGWFFTGEGNTRRGLVVRADPTVNFSRCYQFVIQPGLFQINFRRLDGMGATTLRTWFASELPNGLAPNTWHHMRIEAVFDQFRLWIDDHEFTSKNAPVVDTTYSEGWVGVYNFRFDQGGVPFFTDDLFLWQHKVSTAENVSWGQLKQLWRSSDAALPQRTPGSR